MAKKYQAQCSSGGPGRVHADRTWDGPKRSTSKEAQNDADAHNKKDSQKLCDAMVVEVNE